MIKNEAQLLSGVVQMWQGAAFACARPAQDKPSTWLTMSRMDWHIWKEGALEFSSRRKTHRKSPKIPCSTAGMLLAIGKGGLACDSLVSLARHEQCCDPCCCRVASLPTCCSAEL